MNMRGTDQGKNGWLEGGRRARRCGARNCRENRNDQGSDFKPVHDRHDGDDRRLSNNYGANGRTDWTNVGSGGRGGQIGAKVELCAEEDNPEQQRQNPDMSRLAKHEGTKMELKTEWLRGQVKGRTAVLVSSNGPTHLEWKVLR